MGITDILYGGAYNRQAETIPIFLIPAFFNV